MLAAAVESILEGYEVPTELIIIDQSDTINQDLAVLKTDRLCEIRYLWTQSIGLSRANNAGVTAARYDLVVFTHDDVIVTPAWFGTLVQTLVDAGTRVIVTGRVLPTHAETPGGFAPTLKIDEHPATYEGRIRVFNALKSFNVAMYRSALHEVGGFDVELGPGTIFPGAEDSDLGFRLLEVGYRIVYVPEAVLYHRAWRIDHDYLPLRWNYGVAQGAFYAKHVKLRDSYMLRRIAADVKRRIFRFPRRLRKEGRRAFGDPLYILGNLVGAIRWVWSQRRKFYIGNSS
jgi:GT2 family glycosyltransferase